MISFKNVVKVYDKDTNAVKGINLDIYDNEFIVLVGPSGCGKTSLVRMLAGLETPTSGDILIDGVSILNISPYNRGISFMQQNSKLFPNMTIYKNISFGLEVEKMDAADIEKKVNEIAEILSIKPFLNRKPSEVSGGEYQRAALARALVLNKKIVIFDEPLSSVDEASRGEMKLDIKKIHKLKNKTSIYITHDKTEAMSLADRIVVLKDGNIMQVGTPIELYDNPNDMFTAGFISKMNFIPCENDVIGFRPSDVVVGNGKLVNITGIEILGDKKNVYATYDGVQIEFIVDSHYELKENEYISIKKTYVFDKETKLLKRS